MSTKQDLKKYIPEQIKIAKKLNLPLKSISISNQKNKKYVVELENGKKINYGSYGMEDYLIHRDNERRKKFHTRFKSNKGYNNMNSGLFWSSRLLW